MIAKNNSIKAYDISTSPSTKNTSALTGLFSLVAFVACVTSVMAVIAPIALKANQAIYIVEPFSCKVALADLKELERSTREFNSDFIQEQLELSLKLTREELSAHTECEVK